MGFRIDVDCHVHSQYSYCSEDVTIEKLARAASEKGIRQFFITDHSSHLYFGEKDAWSYKYLRDYSLFRHRPRDDSRMKEYLDNIGRFFKQGARIGIEVDCSFEGEFIIEPEYLKEMELVIGGIHYLPCLNDNPDREVFIEEFTRYTLMLLDKDIDILTHPTRIFRRADIEIPEEVYAPIIDKAVSRGIALEINGHSQKDPDAAFVKEAIARGAKLALGTDTHALKELGDFSWHLELLRQCGIETEEELKKILFQPED